MRCSDYQGAKPPEGLDLLNGNARYQYTSKQAQEYFSWHQAVLQERIAYLLNFCSQDSGVSYEELRTFPDGLRPMWRWFLGIAEVVPLAPDAREEMMRNLMGQLAGHPKNVIADIVADMIPERVLSPKTEEILQDIAMYVGDGFTRRTPKLYWELLTKAKSEVSYNHAIINDLTPPGIIPGHTLWLEPIGLVRIQALHLIDGCAEGDDLYKMITKEWMRGT